MLKNLIRKVGIMFIMFSLIFSMSGCKSSEDSSNSGDETKDVFNVVIKQEPVNLDPHNNTSLMSFTTQRVLFDQLVAIDRDGKIVPKLATEWEFIDDLTIRFKLRDDVYFSNGEKLTAEDVRYSINRATEMKLSGSFFGAFDGPGCAVVDDYTVDIKLKYKFAPVFNYLASPRGDIVCKKAVEEEGDDKFGRNPVGSGPMTMSEWVTGDHIELVRNDDYWGEKPEFKKMILRFISEPANRTIELETGAADLIFDVGLNEVDRIRDNPDLQIISGPSYKAIYVTLNMQDPVLSNPKVREALACSLDIPSLVKAVYGDSARIGDSIIETHVPGHKSMEPREYNIERAKELLAEAGYPDGLNLVVSLFENREYMDISEIAQNMWAQAGINVEIQVTDLPTTLEKASKGEVQISVIGLTPTTGDPDHAMFIFPQAYGGWLQPNDDKLEEYLQTGKSTYDYDERMQVYYDMQDYIWEQRYVIPIAFKDAIYAANNSIDYFDCDAGGTPTLTETTFK